MTSAFSSKIFSMHRKGGVTRLAILGSTGSIGINTLKVISGLKGRFEVTALSAGSNVKLLAEQARRFRPKIIAIAEAPSVKEIKRSGLPPATKVVCGAEGLNEIVSRRDVDLVVFAISGSLCLVPLSSAIKAKKRIALANKESLVSAGSIIMDLAKKKNVTIVPVDSEHSAIFQCLASREGALRKIYLTGSGGPLLDVDRRRFDKLPRKFILNHPKWRMGRKISVDSATMMNKGLEIIEAMHLFSVDEKFIEVLVHPEAIIHSMVELVDGNVFAQAAVPDMRIPIQYALTYPERLAGSGVGRVDFSKQGSLTFRKPDSKKFPCLELAREAARSGPTAGAVLCAADEEAVTAYLNGSISFSRIPFVIEKVLNRHKIKSSASLTIDDILMADEWARIMARSLCYR